MSTELLTALIVVPTWAVVVALFYVMWIERRTPTQTRVAIAGGAVLAVWAIVAGTLAARGVFDQPDSHTTPPVGINFLFVLAVLAASLASSASLRGLLTNQKNLIRLNVWRLVGGVFLLL